MPMPGDHRDTMRTKMMITTVRAQMPVRGSWMDSLIAETPFVAGLGLRPAVCSSRTQVLAKRI